MTVISIPVHIPVEIIVHVVQDSQIPAIDKDRVLRLYAGKEPEEIGLILIDIAVGVGEFVTHGKGLVHDIHLIVVISFH